MLFPEILRAFSFDWKRLIGLGVFLFLLQSYCNIFQIIGAPFGVTHKVTCVFITFPYAFFWSIVLALWVYSTKWYWASLFPLLLGGLSMLLLGEFIESLLVGGLLFAGVCFLFRRRIALLRPLFFTLVVVGSVLLYLVENYLLLTYYIPFSDAMMSNILASNPSESKEFLSSLQWSPYWILPLSFLGIAAIVSFVAHSFFKSKSIRFFQKPIAQWGGRLLLPLCSIVLLITHVKAFSKGLPDYNEMSTIDRVIQSIYQSRKEDRIAQEFLSKIHDNPIGIVTHEKSLPSHTVVLVMGESAQRDFHHCYGYPLSNTPYIDSLALSGDLILYHDAVAPAPNTGLSIGKVLTFYNPDKKGTKEWYQYPTLPSMMSKAGYYSFWLSNQESQGVYVRTISAIAQTADSTRYISYRTTLSDFMSSESYDGDLLPELLHRSEAEIVSGKQNLFQIVHLMGSHSKEEKRYPPSFSRFTGDDIVPSTGNPKWDREKARYVNSILYTDYVLNGIIKSYANELSIVIYLSDHGVLVHDDPKHPELYGHAMHPKSLRIPFMVYFSPSMRQLYPEMYNEVKAAAHKAIKTDCLPESLLQLLGIRSQYATPTREFFRKAYDDSRPRVIRDWDQVVTYPAPLQE